MPFQEPEIPKADPALRPERLMEYDPRVWADPHYVNQVYAWVHRVAKYELETDAVVVFEGHHTLVLLQAPMRTKNLQTGKEFRMMACLLHDQDGIITGWQVDNHVEAQDVFNMLTNPELADEREIPDDGEGNDRGY